jgi:hypothetical protein
VRRPLTTLCQTVMVLKRSLISSGVIF